MFVHYFNRYQVRMASSSFSLPPPDSLYIRPDGRDVNPKSKQELPAARLPDPDGLMFNAKPKAQRRT